MKSFLIFCGVMLAIALCCVPVSCQYAIANGDAWLRHQARPMDMTGFEATCFCLAIALGGGSFFCFARASDI